jgi:Ca2+-binding RTX toxin-like protein
MVLWTEGDGSDTIEMGDGWDILRVITNGADDTLSVTSPAKDQVRITGAGWVLNTTRGDVIEIDTGSGDDVVTVGNLSKTDLNELIIYLGEGDDRLEAAAAAVSIKAYGAAGDDWLQGSSAYDEFYGDAGDDWLLGGPGKDKLEGGSGDNTILH